MEQQSFSSAKYYTIELAADDHFVIVVHSVSDPDNIPAAVPTIGMSVNTGAGSEDVQITGLTANVPRGTPRAGEYVTFIVRATGPAGTQYRFFYKAGYGTPAYSTNTWVKFRDFNADNAATVAFPSAGNYVVVVHVVADPSNLPAALPLIGMNVVVVVGP